jgi:hypothetical protein
MITENVPADRGKILLQQVGMFSGGGMTRRAWDVPENVPADRGKILLQRAGMFSGGGMPRRARDVPEKLPLSWPEARALARRVSTIKRSAKGNMAASSRQNTFGMTKKQDSQAQQSTDPFRNAP